MTPFSNWIYLSSMPTTTIAGKWLTSALVIVRSSPGAAVLPLTALTAMSTALPTVPRVEYQYLISTGMTSITATRGSFLSPLWIPSPRSPNQAAVLWSYVSS